MEVSKDVVYRCVAGEHILIPVGGASLGKNGMFILSEVGGLIWKGISDGKNLEQIVQQILDEYDVDESTHIRGLLEKKHFSYEDADEGEFRRVYSYLLRRGFRSNDILKEMKCVGADW